MYMFYGPTYRISDSHLDKTKQNKKTRKRRQCKYFSFCSFLPIPSAIIKSPRFLDHKCNPFRPANNPTRKDYRYPCQWNNVRHLTQPELMVVHNEADAMAFFLSLCFFFLGNNKQAWLLIII